MPPPPHRRAVRIVVAMLVIAGLLASTSLADRIRLATGEVLDVEITEVTESTVSIRHSVLGDLTIERSKVDVVRTPPSESEPPTSTMAPSGKPDPAEASALRPPVEPKHIWSGKAFVGASLFTGNSESLGANAAVAVSRETDSMKTTLDAGYSYQSADGEETADRGTAGGRNDWLFGESPWLVFADGRYDYDEYQSWLHRVTGHVGPGYKFINEEIMQVTGRAGVGFLKEYESDNESWRLEILAGLDGFWNITDRTKIEFATTIFPDLSDTGEFRNVNRLGLTTLLDERLKMSLIIGLEHEYQSHVDPDRDHNDLRLLTGLRFEW